MTWQTETFTNSLPFPPFSSHQDVGGFGAVKIDPDPNWPYSLIAITPGTAQNPAYSQAYFENDYQFLTRNFEWYFDPVSRVMYLYLCANPDSIGAVVTVPRLQQLLVVDRAAYLSFEGIDFAYAHMPLPTHSGGTKPGYASVQCGTQWIESGQWSDNYNLLRPAVQLVGAYACTLLSCKIAHASGSGLAIETWRNNFGTTGTFIESHFNLVDQCEVFDTGGHGVWIGDEVGQFDNWTTSMNSNKAEPSEYNAIRQSWVHDYGYTYHDAAGIYIAHTRGTQVTDCQVSNGGWTGISIGGFQTHRVDPLTQPSACATFRPPTNMLLTIARNEINSVCRRLADGGGIYMFGSAGDANGTCPSWLDANWVHDITQFPFHSYNGQLRGLYWESGSDGWLVTRNYVANTQYLFVFNGSTDRDATGPSTTAPFGTPTWPVPWKAVCNDQQLTWTWPAHVWPTSLADANRWLSPAGCGSPFQCSCSGPYAGFPCQQGHRGMPASGNVLLTGGPDAVALQTMSDAGPDMKSTWFPQTGERIYQNAPGCEPFDDLWQ